MSAQILNCVADGGDIGGLLLFSQRNSIIINYPDYCFYVSEYEVRLGGISFPLQKYTHNVIQNWSIRDDQVLVRGDFFTSPMSAALITEYLSGNRPDSTDVRINGCQVRLTKQINYSPYSKLTVRYTKLGTVFDLPLT